MSTTSRKTGAKRLKYSLEKHKPYLDLIKASSPKLRKVLIAQSDPTFIKAVVELVANILHGNIPLSSNTKKQLAKHKTYLREVYKQCCSKKPPIKVKQKVARKLLNQRGGFIFGLIAPLIAKAAIGSAAGAATGFLTKKLLGSK